MSFPNSSERGLAKVQGFNSTTMVDASDYRIIELALLLAPLFFPCILRMLSAIDLIINTDQKPTKAVHFCVRACNRATLGV
jgi:hypothetical protein